MTEIPADIENFICHFSEKFPSLLTSLFVHATKHSVGVCLGGTKVEYKELLHNKIYYLNSDLETNE